MLRGQTALITASSNGLGKAIAERLATEGVNIIVNGRDRSSIIRAQQELEEDYDVETFECCMDVTNPRAVKNFFVGEYSILKRIGHLDILINNAGNLKKFGSFFDLDDKDWEDQFNLSFMSMVRLSRYATPWLKKAGGGRIINISSIPAHQPGVYNPHYGSAKAAMNAASKFLSYELAKDHITVNCICPSSLDGGGWHQNIANRAKRDGISISEAEKIMRIEEQAKIPLGRMGELNDVANLVAFLASDQANFLTGHVYNVDGGMTRSV